MSCTDLTADYTLGCREGMGGVHYVIAIQKEHVEDIIESSGEVTAITIANGERGWKIEQEEELAMFEHNPIGSRSNGTFRVEESLNLVVNENSKEVRNFINTLSQHRLIFVVAENNGRFSLAGKERGLMLEGGTGSTGTAKEDRNGYETLPFVGKEKLLPPVVDSTIIEGLLVPAS